VTFQPFDRVQILALDSVSWDLLLPLAREGVMPALAEFLRRASFGPLHSTCPPHTAPAWTTFLTGRNPGRHGVIDFVAYDPRKRRFRFHDGLALRSSYWFSALVAGGKTYGSLFLPRNYPPRAEPGSYVVSGFEAPGLHSRFIAPEDLRTALLSSVPDPFFNFEDQWEPDREDDEAFARNIERAMRAVDNVERLVVHLQRNRPVDVQVAYLQATDVLFHKGWRWCDPATRGKNLRRAELTDRFFRRLDQLIARVLFMQGPSRFNAIDAQPARTLNVLVSDHGHCLARGRIYVNSLLRDWGWLTPLGSLTRAAHRVRLWSLRSGERRARMRELPLDWRRTRAYLAHVGIYGFVYLNLRGREPQGVVAPEQFESVRNALRDRLLAERIPGSNEPLFPHVHKGEEIYSRKKELQLPDLILVPARGFFPRKKIVSGSCVRVTPKAVGGVHDVDGVYAFSGPGVVVGQGLEPGPKAQIADFMPTLLAALGVPAPADLDGRVLDFVFEHPPRLRTAEAAVETPTNIGAEAYTPEEQALVERRLMDLGYLE
jgi:predicted AlkP superfamily phosphohydrolase/phosphomutase